MFGDDWNLLLKGSLNGNPMGSHTSSIVAKLESKRTSFLTKFSRILCKKSLDSNLFVGPKKTTLSGRIKFIRESFTVFAGALDGMS